MGTEKQVKISIEYSYEEYLEQAKRMLETNQLLYEKVKRDHEEFRKILKTDLKVPLNDKDHLKMIS